MQALYNTTGYVPQATDVNSIGVAGYLEEFANDADLQVSCIFVLQWYVPDGWSQTFFQEFLPNAANTGTTLTHIEVNGGGNDQSMPGVEANLDVQYTFGMAFPTPGGAGNTRFPRWRPPGSACWRRISGAMA